MSGTVLTTSHREECPEIGPICEERDEPPQVHDQTIVLSETRLQAELGIADGWGVGLIVPFRVVDASITFRDLDGEAVQLDYENIHHRDETLAGFGDPWLLAHGSLALGLVSLNAQLGVSLPLGRTVEDPFRLAAEGQRHQHLQFGTGTFNPLVTAEARLPLGGWALALWGLSQLVLYENGHGYRAGNRYAVGLVGMSSFGLRGIDLRASIEAQSEAAERWGGVVSVSDGNRGRFDLLASIGAGVLLGGGLTLHGTAKVPLYTHVVGGQLEYPVVLELGLSGHFHPWGEGHDHEHGGHHDHHAPPIPADLDIEEIAPDGQAVDLVPVAGRITVFDFWATWCVPCRELDRALVALLRRHPGRIAVRKVHVETWETPAARRYLGEAPSLPHVRVHDVGGRLAFARSDDPDALVQAIERLIDR